MTLIRRNPNYTPSFSDLFDEFFNTEVSDWKRKNYSSSNTTLPKVNIKEDDQSFAIEMAVPGMKKKDFNIQLDKNVLTVSSEKKEEATHEDQNYTRREFAYQSFCRSFTLPESADAEKIKAQYDDGILSLNIPKLEAAKPKPARSINVT